MSDQNVSATTPDAKTPVFRMQKLYVKDLSFENPNAPEVFIGGGTEPKVGINLGIKNKKLKAEDHWEVALALTATVTDSKSGKTLFIIEIEHAGIFLLKNIPKKHLPVALAVDCTTLMFPFTRQIVSQMSVDGGFIPFLMEPVNFLALFENSIKKKQQEKQQ